MEKQKGGVNDNGNSLAQQCIEVLAANFCERPIKADELPPEVIDEILLSLGPNVDPFILAKHIVSERYWKYYLAQRCRGGLDEGSCTTSKGAALEQTLQQSLEEGDGQQYDLDAVVDHVFSLRLRKVPTNIDLDTTFGALKNLMSLEIQYGSSQDGTSDAEGLGRALSSANALTSLVIKNSRLCDEGIKAIKDSLESADKGAPSIVHLDVSNNKITTLGMKMLLDTFAPQDDCVLSSFIVANNSIDEEGGRFLGQEVLRSCTSLVSLDLRLNMLGDEGGQMIFDGLKENDTLQHICLAGNKLCSQSAEALCAVLENDTSQLASIDVSTNNISRSNITNIISLIEKKKKKSPLDLLDLRGNPGVETEDDTTSSIGITSMMHQNRHVTVRC